MPIITIRSHGSAAQPWDYEFSEAHWPSVADDGFHLDGRGYWTRFSIPLPFAQEEGSVLLLTKVFILFNTLVDANLREVQVNDGALQIATFPDLAVSGDFSAVVRGENSWNITPPVAIRYGLAITMAFRIGQVPDGTNGKVVICGAGAELTY
jgi:hypothetical protein